MRAMRHKKPALFAASCLPVCRNIRQYTMKLIFFAAASAQAVYF